MELGFANLSKKLNLEDRLANLELDVARLKANARS
jgi:hypothetical protein